MIKNNKNKKNKDLILAIDTSCDDTAVAIVKGWEVVRSVVASQVELHQPYGGVHPTIAKLAHQENIKPAIELVLKRAKIKMKDLGAVAVTIGPGLAPALEIGIKVASELAEKCNLPLIGVNHLEAHLWSPLIKVSSLAKKNNKKNELELKKEENYPILGMTFSGGHSQWVKILGPQKYEVLGQSLDDAAGECLDKIGRMTNLGYPAGPILEQLAQKYEQRWKEKQNKNNEEKFFFYPLPLTTRDDYNLSFSGLKTHARHLMEKIEQENKQKNGKKFLTNEQLEKLAASTQRGVFRHLIYKLKKILEKETDLRSGCQIILLGGGVAANIELRQKLRQFLRDFNKKNNTKFKLLCPQKKSWCGDNAAMIGTVAQFDLNEQKWVNLKTIDRKPNWPLTEI